MHRTSQRPSRSRRGLGPLFLLAVCLLGALEVPAAAAATPGVVAVAPRIAAVGDAPLGAEVPRPPQQPPGGPGGAEVRHRQVIGTVYGEGDRQYWLFEPADPAPPSAPVVVLLHGWGAMVPWPYGAWIQHLVVRGYIVIYPRYQASLLTLPVHMTRHAAAAVRAALDALQRGSQVKPELDRVAFVGHSLGGVLAANLAAVARDEGLPMPRALMVVQPGDPPRALLTIGRSQPSIMADYPAIEPETLMLVVVGDRDATVGEGTARAVFYGASRVPPENKDFVVIASDWHGRPALVADHYLPTAVLPREPEPAARAVPELRPVRPGNASRIQPAGPGLVAALGLNLLPPDEPLRRTWAQRVAVSVFGVLSGQARLEQRLKPPDALDFYGIWKLLDGLLEAAFYGRHRRFALGDTPEQRFMGLWSDGVPVRELRVTDHP